MDYYALTDKAIIQMIGVKIRELRLARNVTQKELAESAGVSLSSVTGLERGKNTSLLTLIPVLRMLDALNLIYPFLEERKISPIEYMQIMEGRHKRKRASSPKTGNDNYESEW